MKATYIDHVDIEGPFGNFTIRHPLELSVTWPDDAPLPVNDVTLKFTVFFAKRCTLIKMNGVHVINPNRKTNETVSTAEVVCLDYNPQYLSN